MTDNQQKKSDDEEQTKKKAKRPRKTIEQEISELDAKWERLMEKKRRQEAHEKIIFGATIIDMLKKMQEKEDRDGPVICKNILEFIKGDQSKNKEIINKILINIFHEL